jgi:transcriptional regulator with XRE-family HTH domain
VQVEQLRAIREERGFSRARVAALSGLNPATITRVENGERSPTVETLKKLAAALDIEVGDFFPKEAQASLFEEEGALRRRFPSRSSGEKAAGAYGDDFYGDKRLPGMEMEFTEYLFRLEDLINRWFRMVVSYSHPEAPADASVERLQAEWDTYRLEETCRDFVRYLEERRAGSAPQRDRAASDLAPAEEPLEKAIEHRRNPEVRAEENRSDS